MLTVFCVYWGDKYAPGYVQRLHAMVSKNLTVPHRFVCITDSEHDWPGVEKIKPMHPGWKGWWQKIQLFLYATGPSLYFDLDVVIAGSLDYLVPYTQHNLAAPANWAQSGHGGIQSSVLAWSGQYSTPYTLFDFERESGRLWGDQEFLTELLGNDFIKLPGVVSYKYHCQAGLPEGAAVVVFHGKPDPHEVGDEWVKKHWCIATQA